jgi:hypothetical protein
MLLASNKQHHKEIPKKRKTQQDRQKLTEENSREEQRPRKLMRSSPLTRLHTESFKKL